jgi:hypothetical protein
MPAKDILLAACAKTRITPVPLPDFPQLDGQIFVRVLNAGERHLYGSVAMDARTTGQVISDYEIAAICACESDGTPMFHKKDDQGRISIDAAEVNRLREVDGRIIHEIARLAIEVSGMADGAKDAAKKDSPSDPTTDSSSG